MVIDNEVKIIEDMIGSNLVYNKFMRDEDVDVFINTQKKVIDCYLPDSPSSRIQFVGAQAVLIRLGTETEHITIHILQNNDLYSSIANFEINLKAQRIFVCYDNEQERVIIKRAIQY